MEPHETPVRQKPLTQQIEQILIDRIHSGKYAPDSQLPAEVDLAAYTIATSVSGQAMIEASMSAGGRIPRHVSGLDVRLCGEVAHAVSGMSRLQADELVRRLLAIYEPDLPTNPIGRPFEEG